MDKKKQSTLDCFLKKKIKRDKNENENLFNESEKIVEKNLSINKKIENIVNYNYNTKNENLNDACSHPTLKIYCWNVNGFLKLMNNNKIISFIETENPDIICFNEVKFDEFTLNKLKYENLFKDKYSYHTYWNLCDNNFLYGYSGVSVFTKIEPLNITNGISKPEHDNEGRVLTLEYDNFILICVYVPNAGRELKRLDYRTESWDADFRNYINFLKNAKNKDIIVSGDLNVAHQEIDIFKAQKRHLKSAGFTLRERKIFSDLLQSGYIDTFRHLYPNKIKFSFFYMNDNNNKNLIENKGWRLDYFLINSEAKERLVDSQILNEYDASDHSPIKLIWKK
jgi:exodeoxyribonuclease III